MKKYKSCMASTRRKICAKEYFPIWRDMKTARLYVSEMLPTSKSNTTYMEFSWMLSIISSAFLKLLCKTVKSCGPSPGALFGLLNKTGENPTAEYGKYAQNSGTFCFPNYCAGWQSTVPSKLPF